MLRGSRRPLRGLLLTMRGGEVTRHGGGGTGLAGEVTEPRRRGDLAWRAT